MSSDQKMYAMFDAPVFEPWATDDALDGSSAFIKQCFWCKKGGRACVVSNDADQVCHSCRNRRRPCGPDALGEYTLSDPCDTHSKNATDHGRFRPNLLLYYTRLSPPAIH